MKLLIPILLCLGLHQAVAQIPARVTAEWEMLTAQGGHWVADNRSYKSDNEPADAYGVTWTYGLGKTSLVGRLYSLKDGKETGTHWEFRMYYHFGEKKVKYQQYGWGGVLGEAEMVFPDDTHSEDVAVLTYPDGNSLKIRHVTETRDNVQYSQSYQWKDGAWAKQRYYEWKRGSL